MGTKRSFDFLVKDVFIESGGVTTTSQDRLLLESTRVGSELPNHRAKINSKVSATTELHAFRRTAKYVAGYFKGVDERGRRVQDTKFGYTLSLLVPDPVSSALIDAAVAKCTSRYFSSLAERRRAFAGQQFVGEIRETLKLLRHPFSLGTKALSLFLIRSKKKNATKRLSTVGDMWLEVRFGLLPLMSDITDVMEALRSKATEERVDNLRCYGAAESSTSEVKTMSNIYGLNYVGEWQYVKKAECIIRYGYLTHLLDAHEVQMRLIQESFLNMRDIPGTAWELTPWSFFIDYFVNVGSIIEAMFESQENIIWTSKSVVRTSTSSVVIPRIASFNGLSKDMFLPGRCSITDRFVDRSTAPIGIPPLVFSYPSSNVRLANTAALLTGLLKKA